MGKDSAICEECVYKCDIASKKFPMGTVLCRHCNNTGEFLCTLLNAGSLAFSFVGIDNESIPIYAITFSLDRITKSQKIVQTLLCLKCHKNIPLWFINYNKYLSNYILVLE